MTTVTDWDDATWTDTGSHAVVTGVNAALGEGQVDVERLIHENVQITDQVTRLRQMVAQLKDSHAALRSKLSPLDTGWTPRRDPSTITGAADLTERQQRQAMVAPTAEDLGEVDDEGMPLTPILARHDWPTWLGDVHHADKAMAQAVTDLRAWPEQYAARTIERTTAEPVEISDSYAEIRLKAKLMHAGLKATDPDEFQWAELPAPARSPADSPSGELPGSLPTATAADTSMVPEQPALPVSAEGEAFLKQGPAPDESMAGAEAGPPHRLPPPPPPDRSGLDKLTGRVKTAISAVPERQVQDESTERLERRSWRDYRGMIAGAALGLAAFGALLVGSVVL